MLVSKYKRPKVFDYDTEIDFSYERVQFSSDDKNIVFFNQQDPKIHFYNYQTKKIIATINQENTVALTINASGTLIILGDDSNRISIWDGIILKKQCQIRKYHGYMPISKIQFLSKKQNIVVVSCVAEQNLDILDVRQQGIVSGKEFQVGKHCPSFACSPDEKTIAVTCYNQIKLFDVRKLNKSFKTLKGHIRDISSCKFHPQYQEMLVSYGCIQDSMIWRWNILDGTGICEQQGINMYIGDILLWKDSIDIIYSDNEYIQSVTGRVIIQNKHQCYSSISISSSGQYLAVGYYRGEVNVFDISSFKQ